MSSPSLHGALLGAQSGSFTFGHTGGVAATTSALVGSLTLTTNSGQVTSFAAGSVGVLAVPSSGGAPLTSWALSSASDLGKVYVALQVPNSFI